MMATQTTTHQGRHQHHGPFHSGDHVTVRKYGDAVVRDCFHTGYSGRVEVAYADGSTYHCYPSRLVKASEPFPADVQRGPTVTAPPTSYVPPAAPPTSYVPPVVPPYSAMLTTVQKAPFWIGERVMVKGYGLATVVELPTEGRYAGRVKVQYPDKSTYNCVQAELIPWDRPSHKRHHEYRVGEVVHVKNYGDATVIDIPIEGKYAGRVRVRYDDMSTYHCWRHELQPYFTDVRLPVSVAPPGDTTGPKAVDDSVCPTCGRILLTQ